MARKALGRGLDALIPNVRDLLPSSPEHDEASAEEESEPIENKDSENGADGAETGPSTLDAAPESAPTTLRTTTFAPASPVTSAASSITTEPGRALGLSGSATSPAPGTDQRRGFASGRASAVIEIALDRISANPYQPREQFDESETEELAASIRSKGVLQPVLVRRQGAGYELIAGERRLRAARRAGMTTIPALVRDASNEELVELALIENEQRVELNPIESARSYARMIEEFNLSQIELADVLGRDRSTVANLLRLLRLPDKVQKLVREKRLSMGHARALVAVDDAVRCVAIAERAARLGLSVRAVEGMVQGTATARRRTRARTESELVPFEDRLRHRFGTQVHIRRHRSAGRGRIEIEFYGTSELERILEVLGVLHDA